MKKYVCDICDKIIDKPYNARMKEFLVSYTYENGVGVIPVNFKRWGDFLDICNKREGKLP